PVTEVESLQNEEQPAGLSAPRAQMIRPIVQFLQHVHPVAQQLQMLFPRQPDQLSPHVLQNLRIMLAENNDAGFRLFIAGLEPLQSSEQRSLAGIGAAFEYDAAEVQFASHLLLFVI